jgi:histidinol phosphatase-like enzyme
VLDNTYASRATRNEVIELAWKHGASVRCAWLDTPLEEAQINIVSRMLDHYGRLLGPEEIKRLSKKDPSVFGPDVPFRYQRFFEPPAPEEGFEEIERIPFVRRPLPPEHNRRALIIEADGILRTSRSGARTPSSPDDVQPLIDRAPLLQRYAREGWLLISLAWIPRIAAGEINEDEAELCFRATDAALGVSTIHAYCPHGAGPAVCWCRRPLPGLGVALIRAHQIDPRASIIVGRSGADRTFAERLGFQYASDRELFGDA